MSERVLHVGLVGAGGITATHAQAAASVPGLHVSAIQGSNAAKVEALGERWGAASYTDFDGFLAHRPLDFVAIGSPSGLHAEQGIAAARAGLHVLVEKPIDVTTERADALIRAAAAANVRLGVFFQDRFKPGLVALKHMVAEGELGRPLLVEARVPWYRPSEYYSASRWRGTRGLDGGGALINQAIHTLDLMLWLLGDVSRVQARAVTLLHDIEVEDSGAAILEFACGALGVLTFTTAEYPGYPRRLSVTGDLGTVVVEQDSILACDLKGSENLRTRTPSAPAAPSEAASSPLVSDAGPHRAVIEDFVAAIREGRPPTCDGREGRRSVAVVQAVYESSRCGRAVDVGAGRTEN